MVMIVEHQANWALSQVENALLQRDDLAALGQVRQYITQLEQRVKVLESVTNDMLEIANEADRQEREKGYIDTPGGLENMCDVWILFSEWKATITNKEQS